MKLANILKLTKIRPVEATGYVDNAAVRGSSRSLAHLGKHGEVNSRYL